MCAESFVKCGNSYAISAEALKLEPITLESLKKEKGFKMAKKHQKELDTVRKKHAKERQTMQKNHCSAIEKLTKGKECVEIFYKYNSIMQSKIYGIIFNIHAIFAQQKCSGAGREREESYKRADGPVVRHNGEAEKGGMGITEESNAELARRVKETDRDRASYAN